MSEYVPTIHFLGKQVVSNTLELKFVAPKEFCIDFALLPTIL